MVRIKPVLIALAVAALCGCTTMSQINRESNREYEATKARAEHHMDTMLQAHVAKPRNVVISDLPYVNTESIKHSERFPVELNQRAVLNAPAQSVWRLMQSLQGVSGYQVHADDDLLNVGGASSDAGASLPPAPLGAGGGSFSDGAASPLVNTGRRSIGAITYQGPLKGLLDLIAGKLDATWSFDRNKKRIHFYRFETRTLHVATVPGTASTASAIGTGTSPGIQGATSQSTSATQSQTNTEFGGKLSVWDAMEKDIKPMLSPAGTLTVSQPLATLTVRDRWDRVAEVADYVEKANRSLSTQVQINVTVYRVRTNHRDKRGINWSMLYNALGQSAGQFGLSFASPRPTADGLSSVIINAPKVRADGSKPPFSGSQFFLDALSTIGNTSVVTNSSVSTVNNMPAPVKVVQSTAYVAETTSLLTAGGGSGNNGAVGAGATITPGQVETGFTMQVLPSVQPDGHRLLMQLALSISTLDSLETFTSGGNSVQQPQVSIREFMQRVWMKSGQSRVLAGFQNTDADSTTQTPLSKSLWALGGNRDVGRTQDALVIVLTPIASSPTNIY